MYSLYRAWFGGEESYPRLETLSPPDIVVRVGNEGEYHFVAHRAVLAAHSGYLKALLATTANSANDNSTTSSGHDGTQPIITSVTVPSTIGGEAFAPLLNYMYTGRLEVSLDNIYTVLLATHLLHMPGALEQCRAALLRLRAPPAIPPSVSTPSTSPSAQQPSQSGSVLRPVPNRLLGPAFCWPQSATASHLYPPRHLDLPHLPALQLPSTISVLPTPIMHKNVLPYGTKEPSVSPASSGSQTHQQSGGHSRSCSPELVVASSASSTTQRSDDHPLTNISTRCPSPSASSERISISDGSNEPQQQQHSKRRRSSQQQNSSRQRQNSRSGRTSQAEKSTSTTSGVVQTPGVVYDVACCDGPVRFHRVLNENYAPSAIQTTAIQQHRVIIPQCNGRTSSCHDSDEPSCRENDENDHNQSSSDNAENHSGNYTCGYCRHTFKSQYCYRKHASRHLLPTENENSTDRQLLQEQTPPPPPLQQQQQQQQPPQQTPPPRRVQSNQQESKKREVRLLDLNVQYYPCKICGSKFPSYYFVHKHRKLCHANIEEPQSRSGSANGNEEQITAKTVQQQQQQQQPGTSENVQQTA